MLAPPHAWARPLHTCHVCLICLHPRTCGYHAAHLPSTNGTQACWQPMRGVLRCWCDGHSLALGRQLPHQTFWNNPIQRPREISHGWPTTPQASRKLQAGLGSLGTSSKCLWCQLGAGIKRYDKAELKTLVSTCQPTHAQGLVSFSTAAHQLPGL